MIDCSQNAGTTSSSVSPYARESRTKASANQAKAPQNAAANTSAMTAATRRGVGGSQWLRIPKVMWGSSRLAASAPSSASHSTVSRTKPSPQLMLIEKKLRSTICALAKTMRPPSSTASSVVSTARPRAETRSSQDRRGSSLKGVFFKTDRRGSGMGLAIVGEQRRQLVEHLLVDVGALANLRIEPFDRAAPSFDVRRVHAHRLHTGAREDLGCALVVGSGDSVEATHDARHHLAHDLLIVG